MDDDKADAILVLLEQIGGTLTSLSRLYYDMAETVAACGAVVVERAPHELTVVEL